GVLRLELSELPQLREDLVLGLLADRAGVDEDHVGLVRVLGELVALGAQETGHALRVVLVHLTAIRDEVKLCHELSEKFSSCADLTVAPTIREVNLTRKTIGRGRQQPAPRGINHDSSAGSAGANPDLGEAGASGPQARCAVGGGRLRPPPMFLV